MYIKRQRINLAVTASAGASQAFYSDFIAGGGFVEALQYTPATASNIATGAHITVTAERSGLTIWTATATGTLTRYPHAQAQDVSGGGLGYTSAATPPPVPCKIPVAQERVKAEVTSGGAASGTVGGLKGILDLYISGV